MTLPAVLVVEDERIVALQLKQQLMSLGYMVPAMVANGASALRHITESVPDIVLMDIHIEGSIDGIETASRIPPELDLPVIYLTAYSEDATLERARATKPYGYLIKPYSDRELHATIQMALERRHVASALRVSEDKYRTIVGAIDEGIFLIDAETGQFREANDSACVMFGYDPDELIGRDMATLSAGLPPYTADDLAPLIRDAAMTPEPRRVDWRCKTRQGQLFWAELTFRAAAIGGQTVVLSVMHDLTERRAIEDQLRQAQKMEAVGRLTGGVAHDFNNLLAIMQGNLELLQSHAHQNSEVDELVEAALEAVSRGSSLTHRLLAFSRQQQLSPSAVDVGAMVTGLIGVLRRVVEESVRIETDIAQDLWTSIIDANELENAVLNLALNSRDAMPHGGTLGIEVRNAVLDDAYVAEQLELTAGRYVMISVSDTGEGMSQDVVERALDPFFTTKPLGKGTGLGLPMVYGFVKQSGGHLTIYSEQGLGTTVKLYLPEYTVSPADPATATEVIAPAVNEERIILVVEDDNALRRVQLRALSSLRYRTLEADSGATALAILASDVEVDLLLTDIVLPGGMSGPALADAARRLRPRLKVVFVSGYAPAAIIERYKLSGAQILSKPFTQEELAEAVVTALEDETDA